MEENLKNWIERVSEKREELGGFAICPFANKIPYNLEGQTYYSYRDYIKFYKGKKKNKKFKMYPEKTIPMQFHDPVSPMPMCGEMVSFSEWIKKRDAKMHPLKKKGH